MTNAVIRALLGEVLSEDISHFYRFRKLIIFSKGLTICSVPEPTKYRLLLSTSFP